MTAIGFVGILSLIGDLGAVIQEQFRTFPFLAGLSDDELALIRLLRHTGLLIAGAWAGTALAHSVGLRSMVAEACRGEWAPAGTAMSLPLAGALGFTAGFALL